MDELACPSSSCSARSPSFFSAAGGHQPQPPVLEFEPCDIPQQWLEDDECLDTLWGSSSPPSAGNNLKSDNNKPPAKRRGRKPGSSRNPGSGTAAVLNHVEAERQRRDRLNRRFYDLRAAVPTVSKMDRASILADATAYIAELRRRVERLEAEARQQAAAREGALSASAGSSSGGGLGDETLEVRMLGCQAAAAAAAALRLTTAAAERHAPARIMAALCWLDLPVQHASVCRVVGSGVTVQDAVVDVPAALRDEGRLRAALLHRLKGSG